MKYNALFEYVIRTSGENTDDIDDFDDRDNFWAKNPLFEWVLKEAGINSIQPSQPLNPTNNFPQQRNPQEKPENGKEPPKEPPKKPQPPSIIKDPNLGQNIDILI